MAIVLSFDVRFLITPLVYSKVSIKVVS